MDGHKHINSHSNTHTNILINKQTHTHANTKTDIRITNTNTQTQTWKHTDTNIHTNIGLLTAYQKYVTCIPSDLLSFSIHNYNYESSNWKRLYWSLSDVTKYSFIQGFLTWHRKKDDSKNNWDKVRADFRESLSVRAYGTYWIIHTLKPSGSSVISC